MVPKCSRYCNSQASNTQNVFYCTRDESVYQRTKNCRGIQKARILHCQGKLLMDMWITLVLIAVVIIILAVDTSEY